MESLIASPGAVKIGKRTYPAPPHPERDADFIVHSAAPSRVLFRKEATATRCEDCCRSLPFFHFAGHAVSYFAGGELLYTAKKVMAFPPPMWRRWT